MYKRISMDALLLLGLLFCYPDRDMDTRARIFYLTV
jgi:hypothetical protein